MQHPHRKMITAFILAAGLILPQLALGHNLWLNATDYAPRFSPRTGAHSTVYLGFGHRFPVQDFLSGVKLKEFKLIDGDQAASSVEAGKGGFLATPLILKKTGPYQVTVATEPGFYTMYVTNQGMRHKLGTMEGVENVELSLYFENYAKALINVGQPHAEDFNVPVGHGIEIVPMENPFLKKTGDTLRLKVLHKGKPARFCQVSATYVGFSTGEDYAYSNKTDRNGETVIRLLHPGQWIVLASVRKPAGEELRGKCLETKYSASLSFAIE
ncbi:MAG: hypothetical protein AVO34_05980 [Firmicutes bacterium ML8_F2]|nr:MAG: hypothetical protein AVO34_05980 [Firmicutes bacterium ML8_F2]